MITSLIAAVSVLYALKTANEVMLRHIFPEDEILRQSPETSSSSDNPS